MANIYELTNNMLKIQQLMADGEIGEDVLKDTMEAVEGNLEDKIDGYGKVIVNLGTDIDSLKAIEQAIDSEKKRIKAKREAIENNIKRMKDVVQSTMVVTKKTKIKTDMFTFYIAKNKARLITDDETLIPRSYITERVETIKEVDSEALLNDLKSGVVVSGVHFEQSESLRIR